jgi:hypothetical protein
MKNTRKKSALMRIFRFVGIWVALAVSSVSARAAPYNLTLLANDWFNTDILVTNTTAGVLFYFFIFVIYVGMIILSEHVKMPAFMFLSGLLGFFIGLLFYVIISAIIGFIFIIVALIYMIRSIVFAFDKNE